MWRNYLIVGFRALIRSKTYAFINIAGLAIGLCACLLLLLYVRYETSYDVWLPEAENAYQLQSHYRSRQTGEETDTRLAPYVAAQRLKADFPQIGSAVYAHWTSPVIMRGGEALSGEDSLFVDNLFFDVLQYPFVQGDPQTALREANTVVLSQSEARRLFGTENVMGRTLTMISRGITIDYRVTGVLRDLPRNSHLALKIVARADFGRWFADQPQLLTCWDCANGWVYFTLRPGVDPTAIQAALPAWQRRNIPPTQLGTGNAGADDQQDFRIANVGDIHLGIAQDGAIKPGNDRRTIITFAIIALLILAMASINFINLATARAGQRAREVALRKVLGAKRKQLVAQFLGESVLITSLAMVLALALVELLLSPLSRFLDADLAMTYLGAGGMLPQILLMILFVGAAGGFYPAFYLSRFQPGVVLKANASSVDGAGSGRLRNALVVSQFAISIGLIICTTIVYSQTVYARTLDPGFDRNGLIQTENLGRRQLVGRVDTIAEQMARIPGIIGVGRSGIGVATRVNSETGVEVPGQTAPVALGSYPVDSGFFDTMGIELVAGRLFEPNRPGDEATVPVPRSEEAERAVAARGINVVVNELAARRMGFRHPADAIGQTVRAGYFGADVGTVPSRIIGVVRDSRFRSIREPIEPILFRLDKNAASTLLLRYSSANPQGVRDRVERTWKRLAPEVPFGGEFSEDRVAELYQAEQSRTELFAGFAILAIVVASIGLYGLAAFTAERRTREIGIRKVLGARTRDIVRLLAWQFSKPVILANVIAWPVAWWAMRDWLNTFDARIALGPGPFLFAGLLAFAIAVGTVTLHALRLARVNPVVALRYE